MKMIKIHPQANKILTIVADDGRIGNFDVNPYLGYEAFKYLQDQIEFMKVIKGY